MSTTPTVPRRLDIFDRGGGIPFVRPACKSSAGSCYVVVQLELVEETV